MNISNNSTDINVYSEDYNPRYKYLDIDTRLSNVNFFNKLSYYNYEKTFYSADTTESRLLCLLMNGTFGDKLTDSMEVNINPNDDTKKHILCNIPKPGQQIEIRKNGVSYYLRPEGNDININGISVLIRYKDENIQFQNLLSYMKKNQDLLIENKNNNNKFKQLLLKDEKKEDYKTMIYKDKEFTLVKKLITNIKNNKFKYKKKIYYNEINNCLNIIINNSDYYIEKTRYHIKIYTNGNFNEFDDCLDKFIQDRICPNCTII